MTFLGKFSTAINTIFIVSCTLVSPHAQSSDNRDHTLHAWQSETSSITLAKPRPDAITVLAASPDKQVLQFIDALTPNSQPTVDQSSRYDNTAQVSKRTKLRLPIRQLPTRKYRFHSYPDHHLLNDLQLPLALFIAGQEYPIPAIAKDWQWVDNRLLIALNPNARWSDQSPVSTQDVVTTILQSNSQRPKNTRSRYAFINTIEVFNEHIMAIRLQPNLVADDKINRMLLQIKPASHRFYAALEQTSAEHDGKDNGNGNAAKWVEPTSGPYQIKQPIFDNSQINLVLKKSWWGRRLAIFEQRFSIKKIQYIEIDSSPLEAFLSTELDILPIVSQAGNEELVEVFQQSNIQAQLFNSDCHISQYRLKVIRSDNDRQADSDQESLKDDGPTSNKASGLVLFYSDPALVHIMTQFVANQDQPITLRQTSDQHLSKLIDNGQFQLIAFTELVDQPLIINRRYQVLVDKLYPGPSWLAWPWIKLPVIDNEQERRVTNLSIDPINPIYGGYLSLSAKEKSQVLANMRRRQHKYASVNTNKKNDIKPTEKRKENASWEC